MLLGQLLPCFTAITQIKVLPNHVETIYIDDGPDAVDYKIVKLATPGHCNNSRLWTCQFITI